MSSAEQESHGGCGSRHREQLASLLERPEAYECSDLASCPDCRRQVEEFRAWSAELDRMGEFERATLAASQAVHEPLSEVAIRAGLERASGESWDARRRLRPGGLAVMAALAAGLIAGVLWFGADQDGGSPQGQGVATPIAGRAAGPERGSEQRPELGPEMGGERLRLTDLLREPLGVALVYGYRGALAGDELVLRLRTGEGENSLERILFRDPQHFELPWTDARWPLPEDLDLSPGTILRFELSLVDALDPQRSETQSWSAAWPDS